MSRIDMTAKRAGKHCRRYISLRNCCSQAPKRSRTHEYGVIPNLAVGVVLTRQVAQAGDRFLASQIDHEVMRMLRFGSAPLSVPERVGTRVQHIVTAAVF